MDGQLYGGLGPSELPVSKAVLQLYVSDVGWKPLGLLHKTLHFDFHLLPFIL